MTIDLFVGMMPCYSKADNNLIACKLVSVYPQNTKLGISSHIVYIFMFDGSSGELKAVMVIENSKIHNYYTFTVSITATVKLKLQ